MTKSILTIILTLGFASLTGQTAKIELNASTNWDNQEVPEGQLASLNPATSHTQRLQIKFETQNQNLAGSNHDNFTKSRMVETHSETWSLRDKENLSLQIGKGSTEEGYAHSDDNVLHLDQVNIKISTIEVYDVLGRVLHSTTFENEGNRIPLDHLSDGIYYLVLRDGNNEPFYTQKLALK